MSVSVVIPTYNRAMVLSRALDSVLAQSLMPDEVIVVDDGSVDDTSSVMSDYVVNYPIIKYIKQTNSGPGAARNRGIVESTSKYVAFLDSDDQWLPDMLALQVSSLEKNETASFSFADAKYYDLDGRCMWESRNWQRCTPWFGLSLNIQRGCSGIISSRDFKTALYQYGLIGSCTQVVARKDEVIRCGMFRRDLYMAEDYDMWLRLAFGGDVYYVDNVLCNINTSKDSLTSRLSANKEAIINRINILKEFIKIEKDDQMIKTINCAMGRKYSDYVAYCCRKENVYEIRRVVSLAHSDGWFPSKFDNKYTKLAGKGHVVLGMILAKFKSILIS